MTKHEQKVWRYIGDCVDDEGYLPSEYEIEEHFDNLKAPYEVFEVISSVRTAYVELHDLKGVKVIEELQTA